MGIFLFILTVLVIVVIALVAVGAVTARAASQPRTSIYDRAEAVEYVADLLPDEITGQITFDDLALLLQWHLDYLTDRGVARPQGQDEPASGPLIASEDDAFAYVIGRATDAGLEIDDVWVIKVVEANEAYLRAIGAVGKKMELPPLRTKDEN
ncbi:MAG: hypothetical protein RLZZ31_1952 [Actinomycetota bacterium]|jgi:hypothetical protein